VTKNLFHAATVLPFALLEQSITRIFIQTVVFLLIKVLCSDG
jgi:hypothetical protein